MNPDNETTSQAELQPASPKRARKSPAPKTTKPRIIDPGIAEIHAETRKKIEAYRKQINSSKIADTFINKRIPQLVELDRQRVMDELARTVTPSLLKE